MLPCYSTSIVSTLVQRIKPRAGAATIASVVEAEIANGRLRPQDQLPTVRGLAADLLVSPATVAAAYQLLKQRGFVVTGRARGTSIAPLPPVRVTSGAHLPPGVRDLTTGNPDPRLLPPLVGALQQLDPTHKLYGGAPKLTELVEVARADFARDGIRGDMAITGGALDAIERALQTELRPGDRVVIEDPTWPRIADLVRALGYALEPVGVDRFGMNPDALTQALRRGARAVILTPRGQNPTGAAVDKAHGRALRRVLANYAGVLVIEDDYLARVAGAAYVRLHHSENRWVVVRSLSKVLGPDLRVALVAGDPLTISRIEGRQVLGPGWVSHLLQQLAAHLLREPDTGRILQRAERTYAERRVALVSALNARGIEAFGDSGLGVWIPTPDEAAVVRELLLRGWAVSPGERYRFRGPPGVRVTTAALLPADAETLANDFASLRLMPSNTYTG